MESPFRKFPFVVDVVKVVSLFMKPPPYILECTPVHIISISPLCSQFHIEFHYWSQILTMDVYLFNPFHPLTLIEVVGWNLGGKNVRRTSLKSLFANKYLRLVTNPLVFFHSMHSLLLLK